MPTRRVTLRRAAPDAPAPVSTTATAAATATAWTASPTTSSLTPAPSTLTFVLPLPPNLANSRWHWRVKQNKKKQYTAALDLLRVARLLPPVPSVPWQRATVTAALVLGAAQDDDNAIARCKWALDWIVRAGYLSDDRRKVLRWGGFPEQLVTRKQDYTLTLTLTRCD